MFRDLEMDCVKFAKEVRRANKLLSKVEESAKKLATGQTTAEQKIEAQVELRLKLILYFFLKYMESFYFHLSLGILDLK